MYPGDLKYTSTHEWVRVSGDTAEIGITKYASDELGDIVFVDLPEVGAPVQAGAVAGSIESVKAVAELTSPVSGEIVAVNDVLGDTPETVNEDPYGAGWMAKVKMSSPSDLDRLLDAAAYEASLGG